MKGVGKPERAREGWLMAETGTHQQQGAGNEGQLQPNVHPRIPGKKNYEFTHPDQIGSPAWSAKERTGASRTARDFPSCGRHRPARAADASERQPSLGECLQERSQSRDSRSCGSSQTTTSMIKLKWQKLLPPPPLHPPPSRPQVWGCQRRILFIH